MKYSKEDTQEAHLTLAQHLRPQYKETTPRPDGRFPMQTVYMLVRNVARSGMSRVISTFVVDRDGDLLCLDRAIAIVTERPMGKDGGVRIGGCGMDMGFALLDHAVHVVFGRGVSANEFRRDWL